MREGTIMSDAQATLDGFDVETIICEVCNSEFPKDKSLRLTSWGEPVTEKTEWCCLICASRAFDGGKQ